MAAKKTKAEKRALRRLHAVAREERLLRDQHALRELRKHVTGFESKDGYSLDLKKLAKLPAGKRAALRAKHKKIAQRLAHPHVLLKPRNAAEAKLLRRETQQAWKGAKDFIVQVPDPKTSTASIVEGKLQVTTKLPGKVRFEERFFRFPKRPRSPDEMLAMAEKMDLPKTGEFVMQTDTYGDTGESALTSRGAINQLRARLGDYDREQYGPNRFLNRVIGWRWTRTKLAGEIIRHRRSEAREQSRKAYQEQRRQYRMQARRDPICPHGRRIGLKCRYCPGGKAKRGK